MKIFTDGGARGNPGPAAVAVVVYDDAGNLREKRGKYLGRATNNEAEYQAVIEALEWVKEEIKDKSDEIKEVNFFLDSNLVVNQLNGLFKVKEAKLRELLYKVRELEAGAKGKVTYAYVPREENREADFLVNKTLDEARGTKAPW